MTAEEKHLSRGARQMLEKDLEQSTQPPEPTPAPVQNGPHDSAETYSQIYKRHTKLVFPSLTPKEEGKKGAIILALFVGLSVFAGWGIAYGVEYALTPHVQGTCAPPAVIQNGGCYNVETATGANGNTITTLVPAGHLDP